MAHYGRAMGERSRTGDARRGLVDRVEWRLTPTELASARERRDGGRERVEGRQWEPDPPRGERVRTSPRAAVRGIPFVVSDLYDPPAPRRACGATNGGGMIVAVHVAVWRRPAGDDALPARKGGCKGRDGAGAVRGVRT